MLTGADVKRTLILPAGHLKNARLFDFFLDWLSPGECRKTIGNWAAVTAGGRCREDITLQKSMKMRCLAARLISLIIVCRRSLTFSGRALSCVDTATMTCVGVGWHVTGTRAVRRCRVGGWIVQLFLPSWENRQWVLSSLVSLTLVVPCNEVSARASRSERLQLATPRQWWTNVLQWNAADAEETRMSQWLQ